MDFTFRLSDILSSALMGWAMMRFLIFLLGAALASAVDAQQISGWNGSKTDPGIIWGEEIPMTPDFARAVDTVVRMNLKDPASAIMGPARARGRLNNGEAEIVICGFVNAKNGYGGYNGQQIYIGVYSKAANSFKIIAMGDEADDAASMIAGSCRLSGIPVT